MNAALAGFALENLHLNGELAAANVTQAVVSASSAQTIEAASTLTLSLHDAERRLLRSTLFASRVTARVGDLLWELTKVRKDGDNLDVTFEDVGVADLRRQTGPRVAAPGTTTRSKFARRLVADVGYLTFEAPDTDTALVQLARGSEQDPGEDSWTALGRLAEEVGWRRFIVDRTVFFGPDAWLFERTSNPLVLRELTGGVDYIDFDFDARKQVVRSTVACRADRWKVPAGQRVRVDELGAGAGDWLVASVNRPNLFSPAARIELVRRQPALPEPRPTPEVAAERAASAPSAARPDGEGASSGPVTVGPSSAAGYQWPTQGRVSSEFGQRNGRLHAGIDIAAPTGTPIRAARAGTVTHAGAMGGYGNTVDIDHGGGVTTRYAHASRVTTRRGQRVAQGEQVALVGSTGNSTGPHLHWEVRVGGVPKNPRNYLP